MLQALADFKNRQRKMRCEHGSSGTTGLSSVPRP
jgi:phenylacetate-coenzyme A ligase PaaK-like adenylate-forming protein